MNKDIYAFAKYYFNIYRSPKATNFQVEEGFAEKCFSLGFKMDTGVSFLEKFPKAFENVEELDKIIEDVNDAQFLGTAIFSQWRYITHWSYCSHPLDPEFRPWFISAFGRLMAITAEDNTPPFVFFGNVKKIKIHSNIMSYGQKGRICSFSQQKIDIIIKGNYNMFEINEALFAFDQSLLGD